MQPVLGFPALEGMVYPRLDERALLRIVPGPEAIASMSQAERELVRVLMTSASRGCNAEVLDALPNLGFVISQGAGQDLIDKTTLSEKGVRLRCVGEALTDDVADLAMTLVHMLFRNLLHADQFARSGKWEHDRFQMGDSAVGKTIGIAGLSGRIGQAIARRAQASSMIIAGLKRASNEDLNVALFDDWTALAEASDVIVLAVPGSPELHHVFGREQLSALGPKGRLVNVGRGNLVDTQALIEALQQGAIAGAALDVLDGEPKVPERLAELPNVILTPHIGGQTWGQRARGARTAEDEILAFLGLS